MKKALLFFDLDGTVLDLKEGITKSTIEAIKKLREQGHIPMICTGRSPSFLPKEVLDMDFCGMVASAGGYLSFQGECFYNHALSQEEVEEIISILRKYHMVPLLEGWDYLYFDEDEYTKEVNSYRDLLWKQLGAKWRPIKGNEGNIHINKISGKRLIDTDDEAIERELGEKFSFIVHGKKKVGTTVELIPKEVSKGSGILRVKEFLNLSDAKVYAFGDSDNDIPMFEVADVSVAMGNGNEVIKGMADIIAPRREEDGIYRVLQDLELI